MVKRSILFLILVVFSIGLVSCNNNDNIEEDKKAPVEIPVDKEPEIITEFEALNKTYIENNDISLLEKGIEIVNIKNEVPYIEGQYKEVDFAKDIITEYLKGNEAIYDNLVEENTDDAGKVIKASDNSKNRLEDSLNFLKESMSIPAENPVYYKIDSVTYEGQKGNNENSTVLNIDGYISATDGYFISIANFVVIIYEENENLFAVII